MPASHVPLAIAALSSAGGHEPSVRPSRVRMWQARTSETPAPTAAVRAAKSIDIFCSEVIGELWGGPPRTPVVRERSYSMLSRKPRTRCLSSVAAISS
jgi:hypothetical protein